MNIDLMKDDPIVKQYIELLESFNLQQHVQKPTRITNKTQTLIDHIISNYPSRVTHTDVLPCSLISDHDGPYACIDTRVERFQPRFKYIRNMKKFTPDAFVKDFSRLPLHLIYAFEDLNDQIDVLEKLFNECLETHAPLKRVRVTRPPAPWLKTDNIQSLLTERDRLRKKAHFNSATSEDWTAFRNMRNKIKTKIRQAKENFMKKALSSKNQKEIWRVVHRILKPSPKPLRFDLDSLNEYFITTGARVMGTRINCSDNLTAYIDSMTTDDNESVFSLRNVSQNEVYQEILRLRSDCSTGPDNIPSRFIKLVAKDLAGPLTKIINDSINLNLFPDSWKLSRISPIPKTDTPAEFDELRPIAILPVLSKIYEKLVAKQITTYLEDNKLLTEGIVGYRKGHSTTTALLKIRDDILNAMKQGEITLMVMADYSKAFDTVDFKTVIRKMNNLGFSKTFMKWLVSYLSERKQYVQIDDRQSKHGITKFGVPQGSVLGPLIFNIYVSDLTDSLHPDTSCMQYADDTSLYSHCKVKNLTETLSTTSNDLINLTDWSTQSNLALNSKKTEAMLFSTPQMARAHSLNKIDLNLHVSNTTLNRVESKKLLGVYFQQHLKWNQHITFVTSACYSTLSTLRKIKHFADFKLRKHLVESLILSKIDYNDVVFHPLPLYLIKRLQRVQKAAAGFVVQRYATVADVIKLGWLPIQERRDCHVLKTAYKALHDPYWPQYISLEVVKPVRSLRSSDTTKLTIPNCEGTFQHAAAKLFNELPSDLKVCPTLSNFNNKIRSRFMDIAKEHYF